MKKEDIFRQQLIGQREGIEYALSLLLIHKESLERSLNNINEQIEMMSEIEEN